VRLEESITVALQPWMRVTVADETIPRDDGQAGQLGQLKDPHVGVRDHVDKPVVSPRSQGTAIRRRHACGHGQKAPIDDRVNP
jgi:hypothetical protein